MKKNSILFVFLLSFSLFSLSCAKTENAPPSLDTEEKLRSISDVNSEDPLNSPREETTATATAEILLFNGIGISTSDWKSTEQIIKSMGHTYRLVNSTALSSMSLTHLKTFKLILVPGGNSNTLNNSLSLTTKIKVRKAVRDGGVSYLGICAGAFAAVGIDSLSNTTAYYGFGVAQGDYLEHWYPGGQSSLIAAITLVSFADGTRRNLTWWDGPATPEWPGGVIARYNDGRPAISQTWTGKGFVIVSGPHPEAPSSWQYDTGFDPDGLDHDIAARLIHAAVFRSPMKTY